MYRDGAATQITRRDFGEAQSLPVGALTDHYPRPPRDLVKLAGRPNRESPAQVLDEILQGLAVLLFDVLHAPQGGGAFGVTGGLRGGDRLVVFGDPVVNVAAALGEQPQKVFGLEAIRRLIR